MVGHFVAMFTRHTSGYLAALRQGLAESDPQAVRSQAHTIKGAAANISARRMQRLAARIEDLAREGRLDGVPELFARLEEEYRAFGTVTGTSAGEDAG